MSLPVKILVFVFGLILTITVILLVLIQTQVTPEKIRETLIPLAERHLHRQIDFDEINIGLFSGVSVTELSVKQRGGEDTFLSVKSLKLHYRLWPLFRGQIVVDQILLDKPTIKITRLANDEYNFSDIINRSRATEKLQVNGSESSQKNNNLKLPIDLLMKEVTVSDGDIYFTDRYQNERSPYRYQVESLNLKARNITLEDTFPIDFSAVIDGSQIDISGHYHIADRTGDLLVNVAQIDMIQFAPYYRKSLPFNLGSARLETNLELDLKSDRILSKGRTTFAQVDLISHQYPDFKLKDATLGAEYALSYIFADRKLVFSTLFLNFNELKIGLEGEVSLAGEEPFIVSKLELDQLDLRNVMLNVPDTIVSRYQKYSLAGLVSGTLDLKGPLSSGVQLIESARLNLTDVQMSQKHLRAGIAGELTYEDQILSSDNLFVHYGGIQTQLKLKAMNLLGDIVHGEFHLSAKEIDLNTLQSTTEQNKTQGVTVETEEGDVQKNMTETEDIGPFSIPAELNGQIAIERLVYNQLILNRVSADVGLKENRLTIKNLSSEVNGGELQMGSVVDLGVKGLVYQGQMSLAQPDVVSLVSGLMPQAGQSISGQLQWQTSFYGRGTLPERLLHGLQLKGEFSLLQGMVKGSPLLEQFASFLGNPELKVLSFQSFSGNYDLRDGLARINADLDSSKVKLKPTGTLGVNGRLNLKLDARLAPAVIDRMGTSKSLKQMLTDQQGWALLPLEIKGTMKRPVVAFDSAALQQQALEKTKEKAAQKLLKKIAPPSEEKEPIQQLLDNTLNKLFGN